MATHFHYKRVLQASAKTILIGGGLLLLYLLMVLLSFFLEYTEEAQIVRLVTGALWVIYFPLFFLLYLWTGYSSARHFRLTVVESGVVTAFAYGVIGTMNFVLNTILAILSVGEVFRYQFSPSMFNLDGILGNAAVIGITVCGLGTLIIGFVLNFVVGMCGALLSERE
jgi:hypothetical protein